MALTVKSNTGKTAKSVVGRFAPSPSGRMHLGNVYAALLAYLCARSSGGEFLLRIEDLDPERCPRVYAEQIMDDLRWLGIRWDNAEVPFQSERTEIYARYCALLEEQDLVYPCFCSRAELHAAEAPHASDGRVIYAGTCRNLSAAERADRYLVRAPALRVKTPCVDTVFNDGHYGALRFNLARDWGDFIIRRSDGVWAYQLAVTVDDGLMGVNEVVRGADLLTSAPVQLYLFERLGLPKPNYFHVPLLMSPAGARLAKRDKATDLGFLRARLRGPEALLGYLGHMAGQLVRPEPLTADELAGVFNRDRVPKENITVPEDWLGRLLAK